MITFTSVVPILRIFDIAKADEFYLGFLGFAVDWDHRYEPDLPLYRQVSRGALVLHLSEHHGDGCPGARVRVMIARHRRLPRRDHGEALPLHAPGARAHALGHAGGQRPRSVRQRAGVLRTGRRARALRTAGRK